MEVNIGYIVTALGVILLSMTLHEFMHGLVAYRLGDDTPRLLGRLTINPIKHIDPILTIAIPMMIIIMSALSGVQTPIFGGAKPVPFNPGNIKYGEWGVALMAIAGPLTNLLIAFVCYGLMSVFTVDAGTGAVNGYICTNQQVRTISDILGARTLGTPQSFTAAIALS